LSMSSRNSFINFTVSFKTHAGRFSCSGEVRAFISALYGRGFRIHEIAKAWEVSTRTVWLTLVKVRGGRRLGKNRSPARRPLSPDVLVERRVVGGWWERKVKTIRYSKHRLHFLRAALALLLRWLSYRERGGHLDLEAALRGEEPP